MSYVPWLDIISAILLAGSLAFVGYQSYLMRKAYRNPLHADRIKRAIELAEYYRVEILPNTTFIATLFSILKINERIKNIKEINAPLYFTSTESAQLIGQDVIDEVMNIVCHPDIMALSLVNGIQKTDIRVIRENEYFLELAQDEDSTQFETYVAIKESELSLKIEGVLNKLEYFSMNFVSGVADESVIYQSIHQSFLSNVMLLYCWISKVNTSNCDKFYTATIWLFNKWLEEAIRQECEETEYQQRIEHERVNQGPGIRTGRKLEI